MPTPRIPRGIIPRADLRAWAIVNRDKPDRSPCSAEGYWRMIHATILTQYPPQRVTR